MAVRTCSARRRRVRCRHPRRTRLETYARAKIQQQYFGSPPSTAIRHAPWDTSVKHDTTGRQQPKPITTHRRPRHALRQGERILVPVVSTVIWVVEESFGMTLPAGATDPDSRPLLAPTKELCRKGPSHDVSCLATRHSCRPHAGRRGK